MRISRFGSFLELASRMSETLHSDQHARLVAMLLAQRKAAGLTQAEVARAMGRHQPFIANIENGQRRVDVIELLEIAEIIGLDVHATIDALKDR